MARGPLISMQDVLDILGVSRKTVLGLVSRGDLKGLKVCQQWRFDPADVDEFIERQKVAAVRPKPQLPTVPMRRARATPDVAWKGSGRYRR